MPELAELRFKYAREGDASPLTAQLSADAGHGAIGPAGISPALGFPRGVIAEAGWLRGANGEPYRINPASQPVLYRLQVRRGWQLLSTVVFAPVATNGVIDVNALASLPAPLPLLPRLSSPAAALPGTGFIVADDAAKTATLYWKFSDGSVKSVALT